MADSGTNAPKYIYLQDGGGDEPLPADRYDDQCTWCSDAIESDDTKYIRFDLHEAELAAKKLELAQTQKVRDEWCEEFTKARDDLARVTRERDEAIDAVYENSAQSEVYHGRAEAAERACEALKVELTVAIKEADSWFDECRGIGECPGLDVGRKLLARSKP